MNRWLARLGSQAPLSAEQTPRPHQPDSTINGKDSAPQVTNSIVTRADQIEGQGSRSAHNAIIIQPTPPDRLFSRDALERAWLAIKRAGGGAGVDGMTLRKFEADKDKELEALRVALVAGEYKPQPMRQVLIPKANGGLRQLTIWALRDRIAQRAIYDIAAPAFEPLFLPCSFGFRPGYSTQDAVAALVAYREQGLTWVVDGDIKDCFDSIDSRHLLRLVQRRVRDPLINRYIAGWLFARVLTSADGLPKEAGASQGSALSPLLANIYLHEVDRVVTARKLAYLRYADNFVVCCRRKREAAEALAQMEQALTARGLVLNPHKSRLVHFDQGFAWLGYFFVRREVHALNTSSTIPSRPAAPRQLPARKGDHQ